MPTARVVSHSSGNPKPNFFSKAAFAGWSSKLMPSSWTPFSWYFRAWSRNPQPSTVQPGVSAFG